MQTWQGIGITILIVIGALVIYDKFVKGKLIT
jgi:hypothetical protein